MEKVEEKMVFSRNEEFQATLQPNYDKHSELKAFDDTKAGVKGLVDAGNSTEVPRIFVHPRESIHNSSGFTEKEFVFPVIDLEGIDNPMRHKEIVDKVRDASETWGFFQVVNHGIPLPVLEEMLQGARKFFEQDVEIKKQYYTRDTTKKVAHVSNFDLFSPSVPAASWRDSLYCFMCPNPPSPEEFPAACREILIEFSKKMMKLGYSLFELLSEGLGLNPCHLKDMNCAEGLSIAQHYYPACPQPELTIGTRQHSDCVFITVLLQDDIGGLQVRHQNQWIDVPPTPSALVVNIGDLLQLISNDKYISVEHRVLSNKVGPRISVPCFFSTGYEFLRPSGILLVYNTLAKKMAISSTDDFQTTIQKSYDKMSELKAFDDTKAGIKGLVDVGITKVPQIFMLPPKNRPESSDTCETQFIFPVIDLEGIAKDPIKHKEIVDKVRDASETWGFFQVVNHGIPVSVLEEMLQGTQKFFEQDIEVKNQ